MPVCTRFSPTDFDHDCDVDPADGALLHECIRDPMVAYDPSHLPTDCRLVPAGKSLPADLNQDGDVDQGDFGIIQRCHSGQNQPADPHCAR